MPSANTYLIRMHTCMLTEILGLHCDTMFRSVWKLRKNLYLTASTVSFEGIVELGEFYVTVGFKARGASAAMRR